MNRGPKLIGPAPTLTPHRQMDATFEQQRVLCTENHSFFTGLLINESACPVNIDEKFLKIISLKTSIPFQANRYIVQMSHVRP